MRNRQLEAEMATRKGKTEKQLDNKQKKNFNSTEIEVLLQGVTQHKTTLFSSVPTRHQAIQKESAWSTIAGNINAVSTEKRATAEVKKKCFDLK